MIICTIGNKCLNVHSKIECSIAKLADAHNITLNILKKYTPTEFSADDLFYTYVDKDKITEDERRGYFVSNMYTLPKMGEIAGYSMFFEYIDRKDFISALLSDDVYIIDLSKREFRTLYSFVKVFYPDELYRFYPIFIKSGSEYDRLINLIDKDMTPEEIHYYCRLLLFTYDIQESNMPEGFTVNICDVVDKIIKSTLLLTNRNPDEFKEWEYISPNALELIYMEDK